jgi:hypothetical protein
MAWLAEGSGGPPCARPALRPEAKTRSESQGRVPPRGTRRRTRRWSLQIPWKLPGSFSDAPAGPVTQANPGHASTLSPPHLKLPGHPSQARANSEAKEVYVARGRTAVARGPFSPRSISNSTLSPSFRLSKFNSCKLLRWKKISWPSADLIKPNPRSRMTLLIVPCIATSVGVLGDLRGGSAN